MVNGPTWPQIRDNVNGTKVTVCVGAGKCVHRLNPSGKRSIVHGYGISWMVTSDHFQAAAHLLGIEAC